MKNLLLDKKIIYLAVSFWLFVLLFHFAQAAPFLGGKSLIPKDCVSGPRSQCGVEDFMQLLVNVFQLMLGVLGSLSLLFFVYGGFVWILSRGNTQMIEKGKSILIGSIIGLSLVLGSWVIVNLVINILTGGNLGEEAQIFGKEWSKFFD